MKKTILIGITLISFLLSGCQIFSGNNESQVELERIRERKEKLEQKEIVTPETTGMSTEEVEVETEAAKTEESETESESENKNNVMTLPPRKTEEKETEMIQDETASAETEVEKAEEAKAKETEKEPEVDPLWTKNMDDDLASFMVTWGRSMGQQYRKLGPGNNVDMYGVDLPDAVLEGSKDMTAILEGSEIKLRWSENGINKSGEYAVVAAYSDAETRPGLEQHTYLFVIKDGQPYTIINMYGEDPSGSVSFIHTANTDLRNGFYSIVTNGPY